MSERVHIEKLRATDSYQWGPFPWSEDDASEPRVEVSQSALLALVEAVEAAQDALAYLDHDEADAAQVVLAEALARFDFGDAA